MAYTPYEWTVNSYLNPTRMNAIEQGIAAASQAAESASGEFHTIEELIGTQSIAGIGDGTLTGATWKINNDLTELSATVTTLNSKLDYLKIETVVSKSVTVNVNQGYSVSVASIPLSEFGLDNSNKIMMSIVNSTNGWVMAHATYDSSTNSIIVHANAGASRETTLTVHLVLK